MAYTLRHRDKRTNYLDLSDPESDSYSSDSDSSRFRTTRSTARRNTTLCTPRTLETEMVDSSVDLTARCGRDRGQGGNTTLCTPRAMETEMVDSSVDLIARRRQVRGRGGNTTLPTPRAMETELGDSRMDLIAGKTLCTPRAMETEMVVSSVDLIARQGQGCGQGGNTTLCTPRAMETEMVDSSVDLSAGYGQGCGQDGNTTLCTLNTIDTELVDSIVDAIVGNTTLCTPREMETEMMDSSVDLIARRGQGCGQGGNKTLCSPRAIKTKMVDSSVDFIARRGRNHGRGGNTTLCNSRAIETEMVDSRVDLIAGNTTSCTPRAMETEKVDPSADLIARSGRVRGRGQNKTLCTSRAMETKMVDSSVDLIAKRRRVRGQGGKTTSCTPRAMENEMVGSSVDLIARRRRVRGRGGNTTLCPPRAMETEIVSSSVNLIARRGRSRGRGGNTTSCTPRAMETEMVESSVDLIARRRQVRGRVGNTTLHTPRAMETEVVDSSADRNAENTPLSTQRAMETKMVVSSVDLTLRHGRGRGRGGNTTLCSPRAMETELVDSGVDLTTRNTTLRTPRAMETEMVHSSVDLIARRGWGRGRGGRGHGRSRRGGGRGGGGTRWGRRGTRGRSSQMRVAEGEQNKETSNSGPCSIMEKGLSSPKGQTASTKSGPPSPERVRSCKKTILSWLIDCKLIEEDEQVCYMDGTKESATMTGRITRGGILCSCCQRETSVWTFEKHAGSDLKQPYEHIYLLRKGTCLQDCQIAAWQDARERKHRCMFSFVPKETTADQNDDACSICGDGGDLICCDKCPSTYHPSCMNMERVPHCDWLCPYCICKYCGLGGESKQFITCSQCDKKFHWGCFKEFEKEFSKETLDLNCSRLYCGPGCRQIYEKLEGSLGIRNDIFASYSWRVIRQMDMTPKVISAARNLHLENNSKVAVACMLLSEAFETITDRHTGINVVRSVVYSRGSNLARINFSRFYTFVLEKDDEIIAAASIRFHGRRIAEMPFIATDEAYRGQGICRALMRVIESFLCNLKIENLIIPSILETSRMWKHKYSFKEVSKELKREIPSYNILMFPHALRMYKDLSTCIADGGNDIEDNQTEKQNGQEPQTDNQNSQEPQMDQAERPLLDLNVDPNQED